MITKKNVNSQHIINLETKLGELFEDIGDREEGLLAIAKKIQEIESDISKYEAAVPQQLQAIQSANLANAAIQRDIGRLGYKSFAWKAGSVALWATIFVGPQALYGGKLFEKGKAADEQIEDLKKRLSDIPGMERRLDELKTLVVDSGNRHTETQQKHSTAEKLMVYQDFVQKIIIENAIAISKSMQDCAHESGTDLDQVLSKLPLARSFASGELTQADLKQALTWAGKQDVHPRMEKEELAFIQFIRQEVIPQLGYFQVLASKIDDLRQHDVNVFPALEILDQKPVSLSGSRQIALPEQTEEEKAAHLQRLIRRDMQGNTGLTTILREDLPHIERLRKAVAVVEESIAGFNDILASIDEGIDGIESSIADASERLAQIQKDKVQGVRSNSAIETSATRLEQSFDVKKAGYSAEDKTRLGLNAGVLIATKALKHSGQFPVLADALDSTFTNKFGNEVIRVVANKRSVAANIDALGIQVAALRAQKIDMADLEAEIEKIREEQNQLNIDLSNKISDLGAENLKRLSVGYLNRSLLRSALNNSLELEASCKLHGINSVDEFMSSFDGRVERAVLRFCHGVANSNDLMVIVQEANAYPAISSVPSHIKVLKDFIEYGLKPNLGAYISKSHQVDKLQPTNLVGIATDLFWDRELVREETDKALDALLSSQFGMSVVGAQDVRAHFDFWMHRHGDTMLHSARLNDGQVSGEDFVEKRVNVLPTKSMDTFVNRIKHTMTYRNSETPAVSDLFLRVCGYEYLLPLLENRLVQDNIFFNYPETPAAYPMANTVIQNFIQKLSLGNIDIYRQKIGDRLDNLIAQTFMDFFSELGQIHYSQADIREHRNRLFDARLNDDFAPVLDSYINRITSDAVSRFDLFRTIYTKNLETYLHLAPEQDAMKLRYQLHGLTEPSRSLLRPKVAAPGSEESRFKAQYEDHSLGYIRWSKTAGGGSHQL